MVSKHKEHLAFAYTLQFYIYKINLNKVKKKLCQTAYGGHVSVNAIVELKILLKLNLYYNLFVL